MPRGRLLILLVALLAVAGAAGCGASTTPTGATAQKTIYDDWQGATGGAVAIDWTGDVARFKGSTLLEKDVHCPAKPQKPLEMRCTLRPTLSDGSKPLVGADVTFRQNGSVAAWRIAG